MQKTIVVTLLLFLSLLTIVSALPIPTIINNSGLEITKYDGVEAETYLPEIEGNQLCLYHKAGTNATSLEELKQLIQEAQDQVPNWEVGINYQVGDLVKYNDLIYKVLQSHTSQAQWTPPIVPALFVEYAFQQLGEVPQWTQPTGGHDAYNIGDRVWFEVSGDKLIYESLINANVWSPTAYPAGWKNIGMISESQVYGDEDVVASDRDGGSIVVPRDLEDGLSTYCVEVTDYIKIGNHTIIAEWINDTIYNYEGNELGLDPFMENEISFLCNDVLIEGIIWQSNQPIEFGVKFNASVSNFSCDGKLTRRQTNPIEKTVLWNNQFAGEKLEKTVDFSAMEDSPGNNITSQNKSTELPQGWDGWYYCVSKNPLNPLKWYSCMEEPRYYDDNLYGVFTDLDPLLQYTHTTSEYGFYNQTGTSNLGVSLEVNETAWTLYDGDRISPYIYDSGDFKSLVFYNETSTYWNTTFSLADSDYQDTLDYVNTTGLVSYWRLDGDVVDSVGGNDGTSNGDTDTVGIVGHARVLGGTNEYVDISDADMVGVNDWTLSTWVKTTDNSGTIFDASAGRIMVQTYTGNTMRVYDGVGYTVADVSIDDGAWHLLTFNMQSDGSFLWYKDGVLENTSSINAKTFAGNMRLGYSTANSYPLAGSIDEVLIFNRSLSADEIIEIYQKQKKYYEINISDPNLVSYWELNEDFTDTVGGNDGTPSGTNNATGISSGAMMFDGVGDYVSFTSTSVGTTHSASAWIKLDATPVNAYNTIVGGGTTNAYLLTIGTSDKEIYYHSGAGFVATASVDVGFNEWHYVTSTRDGTNVSFYYDGNYISSHTLGSNPSISIAKLGIRDGSSSSTTQFDGIMDEVLIYNKSLTASEVEDLYKAGLTQHANANVTLQTRTATGYNVSDVGLVGLWGLNGNANDELGRYNCSVTGAVFNEGNGTVGEGVYLNDDTNNLKYEGSVVDATLNASFSFWIYHSSTSGTYNTIIMQYNGASNRNLIYVYNPDNKIYVSRDGGAGISSNYVLTDNEWTYVTINIDDTNNKVYFYFDGVYDTVKSLTNTFTGGGNFTIGGGIKGAIDEVRIYNRSLSADEIQNLYELGSYHIEWGNWEDLNKSEDLTPKTTLSGGNFMQFRTNLNSDDTDVSPYILNYSVGPGTAPVVIDNPPYWLELPTDTSILDHQSILELNNVTDDNGIDSCWTNESFLGANSTNYYNITSLTYGTYSINLTCNDTIGQTNSTFFTIEINSSMQIPIVSIDYPINLETYTTIPTTSNFTVTYSDGGDSCWYQLASTGTNSTPISATTSGVYEFTSVPFSYNFGVDGIRVWCNNTMGGIGTDSVVFYIDLPPTINIDKPTTADQDLVFNLSISSSDGEGLDRTWYSWKGVNYTYTNSLDLYASAGTYTIMAWANDTYGSVSSDSVTFTTRDFDTNASTECGEGYYLSGSTGGCKIFPTCASDEKLSFDGSDWSCIEDQTGGGSNTLTTSSICRYKRYGYYNTKLPWMRQENCI